MGAKLLNVDGGIVMATYKVTSNASIRVRCGSTDSNAEELLLSGLQSTALPIGFTASTITVSEMGTRIDKVVPVGGAYEEISINYNFAPDDESQVFLMDAALNNTDITTMRFYLDDNVLCGDFVALDLISDPNGAYRVGTFSSPQGSKNELFTGTVSFLPAGASTLFTAHSSDADATDTMAFTSGAAGAATVTRATGSFVTDGFEDGMTMLVDNIDASTDPFYVEIDTVAALTITLVEDSGADGVEDAIAAGAFLSTTAIHGGSPMLATDSNLTCT